MGGFFCLVPRTEKAMLVQENVKLMHKVYNNNSSSGSSSSYNNNVHNDSHKTNKSPGQIKTAILGRKRERERRGKGAGSRKILRVNNVCPEQR